MKRTILSVLIGCIVILPALAHASVVMTGHVRSVGTKGPQNAGVPLIVIGTLDDTSGPARLCVEITDETVFAEGASLESLKPGQPVSMTLTFSISDDFIPHWTADSVQLLEGELAKNRILMKGTLKGDDHASLLTKAEEVVLATPHKHGLLPLGSKTTYLAWVALANVPVFQHAGFSRLDTIRVSCEYRRLSRVSKPIIGSITKPIIETTQGREFRDDAVAEGLDLAKAFERDWQGAAKEHYSAVFDQLMSTKALTDKETAFTVEFTLSVTFLDEADGTWKEARSGFSARTDLVDVEH